MALRPDADRGLIILEVSRSHTTRTTVGRTPLDERSARRRDLYLTTRNTQQQTSISPAGFEPTISPADHPKTYALDRATAVTVKTGLTLQNRHFVDVFRSLYACSVES